MIKRLGIRLDADSRPMQAGLAAGARQVRTFAYEVGVASQSVFNRTNLMQAGMAATAVVTVLALKETVGAAIGFEVEMRNVNSIMHETEEQLERTSAQVLNLGKRLPQDAETLARGLYDIASSGFQGGEGLMVLEASAQAATAGMTNTATAAKGITAVLNAYGLEAKDAADVSDVLFQTVNLGVVTFEELSSQLGDVVGIAAAANVGIDEVGAAIAAMTLSGINAAESTTSLNRVLQALLQPSEALAAVWRSVSDESLATALAQEGLHAVMERIRSVVGDNVQVLLALFPEIRAARGAFALLAAEGENYRITQEGITDEQRRAQATQKAFDEQMKATGNQLRLVANNARIWGIEMGSKALPAITSLIQRGRDIGRVVVPAFRAAGEVVGFWTDELVEHREILYAIGILYGTHLAANVLKAGGAFLNLQRIRMTLWLMGIVEGATGAASALGKIAVAAAPVAGALVAALAIKSWMDAKEAARAYVAELQKGLDLATAPGLREYSNRLAEQAAGADLAGAATGSWSDAIAGLISSIPGFDHTLRDNTLAANENAAEQERIALLREQEIDNIMRVNAATKMNADEIRKLAQRYGIDLFQGGKAGVNASNQLIASIEEMSGEVGLTKDQFEQLGVEAVDAIARIAEEARTARGEFVETFGLLSDFELPDPRDAAENLAEATDTVREAEERLAEAKAKARDSERYIVRTPDRDREAAEARREVASAERDLAKAREEARAATLALRDPETLITEQYEEQIAGAEQFIKDIDTAVKKGVSPEFILKAQLNPEQYAPILRAIAEDTDGSLVQMINDSEQRLRELGDRFEAQFGVMKTAVENGMTEINDVIQDYMRRALSDPAGELAVLAYRFGADIMGRVRDGVAGGTEPGHGSSSPGISDTAGGGSVPFGPGIDAQGSPQGDGPNALTGGVVRYVVPPNDEERRGYATMKGEKHKGTYYRVGRQWWFQPSDGGDPWMVGWTDPPVDHEWARGGIDAHIATRETVLFGERSTGGEAYIPLGPQHRARSIPLWEVVGQQLGVLSMAQGGIVGASVNNYSNRGGDVIVDTVVAQDFRDFERQMEHKRRLASLRGGF